MPPDFVAGPTRPGPPGQASFYFNDPFGNHLELVTLGSYARSRRTRSRIAGRRGAKVPRPEVATKDEYKTARAVGQLPAAQDPHQIGNLAPGGGPARFEVLLHTQTSIESQDHTG